MELKQKIKESLNQNDDHVSTCLLSNVSNVAQADLLISLLEANGLYAMKSFQSSGSYLNILHGFNYQGVDIVVAEKDLEQAKEIISVYENEAVDYIFNEKDLDGKAVDENNGDFAKQSEEIQNEAEAEKWAQEYLKKKVGKIRVLIWIVFLIPIILGSIVIISQFI